MTVCFMSATVSEVVVLQYRDRGAVTVELLDTESESVRGGSEGEEEEGEAGKEEKQQQLEAYVARFLGPGEPLSLSPCTVTHLARKPVFLSRSVKSYRAKTRHRIVPRQAAPDPAPPPPDIEQKELASANR